ncbi:MAG: DUF2235 domain-containing protein [Planctomycetaceae bacterium]|nr:DUF2235 domain-containing protein [Planctomycetaceae bacterium]
MTSSAENTNLPKNKSIIICSDGTGNVGGNAAPTNVWRIHKAVRKLTKEKNERQILIHQDGVGTSTFLPLEVIGKAISFGITSNLEQLYARLMEVYEPGDRIYMFGFSRGAFTIRTLAYMLHVCGLADKRDRDSRQLHTIDRIREISRKAVIAYKCRHVIESAGPDSPATTVADQFRTTFGVSADQSDLDKSHEIGRVPISFVGVWDTVAAVGLPFENLTQWLFGFWCRVIKRPAFRWLTLTTLNFHRPPKTSWKEWKDDDLHPGIQSAFHAISIDDERETFRPLLWLEFNRDGSRKKNTVKQVWFPGVHANVGGGYAKDQLAHVSLVWMIRHAEAAGLEFDETLKATYEQEADPLGTLHDSRAGLAVYYRYRPRVIEQFAKEVGIDGSSYVDASGRQQHNLPFIHHSTLARIENFGLDYAPSGIPGPNQYEEESEAFVPLIKPLDVGETTKSFGPEITVNGVPVGEITAENFTKAARQSAGREMLNPSEQRWRQNFGPNNRPGTYKALESIDPPVAGFAATPPLSGSLPGEPPLEVEKLEKAVSKYRQLAADYTAGYVIIRRSCYYAWIVLSIIAIAIGLFWQPGQATNCLSWAIDRANQSLYGLIAVTVDSARTLATWPVEAALGRGIALEIVTMLFSPVPLIVLTPPLVAFVILSLRSRRRVQYPAEQHTSAALALFGRTMVIMLIAWVTRPAIALVVEWIAPGFVEPLLHGVFGSPIIFTFLSGALYLTNRLNNLCCDRIREWNVLSWRYSRHEKEVRHPDVDRFDRWAQKLQRIIRHRHGVFGKASDLLGRFVVPAVGVGILVAVFSYPVWITIKDVLIRIRLQRHDSAAAAAAQTVTSPANNQSGSPEPFIVEGSAVLATGMYLRAGQVYVGRFEQPSWQDGDYHAGKEGVEYENRAMKLAGPLRRMSTKYMTLCGCMNDPTAPAFLIRDQQPFSPPSDGYLFLFANDVPGFYFNNTGELRVTIQPL